MRELQELCDVLAFATVVATMAYTLFAPPAHRPSESPPAVWLLVLFGGVLFVAIWPWIYILSGVAGWIFSSPNYERTRLFLFVIPTAISGLIVLAACLRLHHGWAPPGFMRRVCWLSVATCAAMATVMISRLSLWPLVFALSPVFLAAGWWMAMYRRQLGARRLSLGSVFALMTALAVGLALTSYLRS